MAIKRIWHGWTTPENAQAYWMVLRDQVIPNIEARLIQGYQGFDVLRRDHDHEIEFITIISFESLGNVIEFQGEDYTRAFVPEAAREVLSRWDQVATHYEVLDERANAEI